MSATLPRYSFLPFLRRGLAAGLQNVDPLGAQPGGVGERASLKVVVRINDAADVSRSVNLLGPGDILGIDERVVVRTDPRRDITDFEPNYFPSIEFYDEDFPWCYTPAAENGQQRLRPWLALVVLEKGEFELTERPSGGRAFRLTVPPETVLPPADQTWAWAHVHVNEDLLGPAGHDVARAVDRLRTRLDQDPNVGISRLLCPRRLKADTKYHAFVIPTFEAGRRAGLGIADVVADATVSAWGPAAGGVVRPDASRFPVYYDWKFRTGTRGDFEYLVRLLQPRVLDPRVGIRPMDVQEPGLGLPGIADPPALGLEGALKTLQTKSTVWNDKAAFQDALRDLLNFPADAVDSGTTVDPVIAPPIYGRWHAPALRVGVAGTPPWLETVNRDPRPRAAAGMGTLVIRTEQERLMVEAWRQFGQAQALAANAMLRRAAFSRFLGDAIHVKTLQSLDDERALRVTAPVHKVILGSPTTVQAQLAASRVPVGAMDPAFRRLTRERGPIARRFRAASDGRPGIARRLLQRINRGEIAAAWPRRPPTNLVTVDAVAGSLLPAGLPDWLRGLLPQAHWWFLVVFAVLFVALAAAGALGLLSGVALAGAGVAGFTWLRGRAEQLWSAPEQLTGPLLTVAGVSAVPPNPDFHLTPEQLDGAVEPAAAPAAGRDSPQAARFRRAAVELNARFERPMPAPAIPGPADFGHLRAAVSRALQPSQAVARRMAQMVALAPNYLAKLPPRPDPIEELPWAPSFLEAMYKPLAKISKELLVPNLDLIPQNTIALLTTNEPFIEAYMLGLNQEFSRELLWREYPAEARATFFRQFWGVEGARRDPTLSAEEQREAQFDIRPIHAWRRTADLGDNRARVGHGKELLVLTIRSDVFKKYPNTVVSAQQAVWPADKKLSRTLGTEEVWPLFEARVDPDLTFFGFDLTPDEVRGSSDPDVNRPGWYFVLKERPGEPRFAFDDPVGAGGTAKTWDDLSWNNVTLTPDGFADAVAALKNVSVPGAANPDHVAWSTHGAHVAYITYQSPVLIAIHASEMLTDEMVPA